MKLKDSLKIFECCALFVISATMVIMYVTFSPMVFESLSLDFETKKKKNIGNNLYVLLLRTLMRMHIESSQ